MACGRISPKIKMNVTEISTACEGDQSMHASYVNTCVTEISTYVIKIRTACEGGQSARAYEVGATGALNVSQHPFTLHPRTRTRHCQAFGTHRFVEHAQASEPHQAKRLPASEPATATPHVMLEKRFKASARDALERASQTRQKR
jgi:hypothetical protein